jgi:flagellar protein FlaG
MSLEVLSGNMYNNETSQAMQKSKSETNTTKDMDNTGNLNITESSAGAKIQNQNQAEKGQEKGQKETTASEKQIKDAISKANNKMKTHRTRCEFSYNEGTKRVSIKVLDRDTEEVLKEIPPEETLEMVERMWDLAGLLVDERR